MRTSPDKSDVGCGRILALRRFAGAPHIDGARIGAVAEPRQSHRANDVEPPLIRIFSRVLDLTQDVDGAEVGNQNRDFGIANVAGLASLAVIWASTSAVVFTGGLDGANQRQ